MKEKYGEENVAHLRKLVAEIVRRGAEVLVADGDVGDNLDEQETLLGVLTDTGLPVVVAAGNREVRSELDAAENDLRKKGAKLWDLSRTRLLDAGDALIVGLPGTLDRRFLHGDGACVYVQRDIDALAGVLDRLPGWETLAAYRQTAPWFTRIASNIFNVLLRRPAYRRRSLGAVRPPVGRTNPCARRAPRSARSTPDAPCPRWSRSGPGP